MFLESSSFVAPDNFPGNFPVNLQEPEAPIKLLGGNIFANKNKVAAAGGLFFPVRQPRTYQVRTVLFNMDECEVIERFRLSSAR